MLQSTDPITLYGCSNNSQLYTFSLSDFCMSCCCATIQTIFSITDNAAKWASAEKHPWVQKSMDLLQNHASKCASSASSWCRLGVVHRLAQLVWQTDVLLTKSTLPV